MFEPDQIEACVFDAYGTLFDVGAAARRAAADAGPGAAWVAHWPAIAATWRRKQLEYTWLRAIAGAHADFWQVTQDALDWALQAHLPAPHDATNDATGDTLRARLLALYWSLEAFPEVPAMLDRLAASGRRLAILSNGSPGMLQGAVEAAGLGARFEALISVEEVGVFKPHASVYALVERHLSLPPARVLFVSSNGWDACSAAAFGFRTAWVNRMAEPLDRLHGRPDTVLPDLATLPGLVAA